MGELPIPQTIEEFQIALGRAILTQQLHQLNKHEDLEEHLAITPNSSHVITATRWLRNSNPRKQLRVIGTMARLALDRGDVSGGRIFEEMREAREVRRFLESVQPRYVADVIYAGFKQAGQPLTDFLELLEEISP